MDNTNNHNSSSDIFNNMDSKQETGVMPVSIATLRVLPHDVGQRLKEGIAKTTINLDAIKKANELVKKKIREIEKMKLIQPRFKDFYEAYNFLAEHEMCKCKPFYNGKVFGSKFNYFSRCLDISVVKVNPNTLMIEDTEAFNANKTQVWLEFGRAFLDLNDSNQVQFEHDTNLDTGGDTFEDAIISLANLVDKHYNDDGTDKDNKGDETGGINI